jgi:hypothetical protein
MEETYFPLFTLQETLHDLEARAGCPRWLVGVIGALADHLDLIPFNEDEDRFVTEFIYPH